ncbi:MAG: sulfate ABC transporter substrate-binding protein [Actinomycetota bacterium]|nr:sulfate ABC transporter substrate-binding protein [Actinomycetota bacterium]
MPRWFKRRILAAPVVLTFIGLAACSSSSTSGSAGCSSSSPASSAVVNFAGYSTPREVYDAKIIPTFVKEWKDKTGQTVLFNESYAGSTTQAQNVVNGLGSDVVALSLAPDVQTIQDAGLITHDWTQAPDGGMVSASVAVFDVRAGNPKGIKDWSDLAAPGTGVLTPDPAQSGGARWNLVALWGAALRGDVTGIAKGDEAAATTLMQNVTHNVISYDKSARDSIQNFESGNGDVAITYENEVKTAQAAGEPDTAVYPKGTVLIENPVAVVDKNAQAHCVEDVANAFVDYLHTKEAKDFYTTVGYLRPVDPTEAAAGDQANGFPAITDLFTVADLGGWDALNQKLFSDTGIATQAIAQGG